MILLLLQHFTLFGGNGYISPKSAISAKKTKFPYFRLVTEVGPKVTILEARNRVLQQHSRPWARNGTFSLNFTNFEEFGGNGGI